MNYYTAEYSTANKTFIADNLTEAKDHARVIGYGEAPLLVREATDGEIEGLRAFRERTTQALRGY